MYNEDQLRQTIREMVEQVLKEKSTMLHQSQIPPKVIKQRHIEDTVIKRGLAADRPTSGGAVGIFAYFSTDNNTLAIWNGTAWVEEILT